MKRLTVVFGIILLCGLMLRAQPSKMALNGEWSFALDPVIAGEHQKWYQAADYRSWDKVTVPHSYSVDKRYHGYTGTAWYVKSFSRGLQAGKFRSFIRFEAVFYRAKVWLNGKHVGDHEGGYTPFEWDVTDFLKESNTLVIQVSNVWDTTTIPGARTQVADQISNSTQVYPWINYGGITRDVYLITRPEVYPEKIKIEADPDLIKGTASVRIAVDIRNKSNQAVKPTAGVSFYLEGKKIPVKIKSNVGEIGAGTVGKVLLEGVVSKKDLRLWNQDEPVLYQCEIIVGTDTVNTNLGIRKLEIQGTKLLLNGEPIRMGGCNRPLDYPGFGSMDPQAVVEQDLTLIKNGGMEFSRMSHYPMASNILDWADRHGLLIIGEPGNWQLTQKQMSDPEMRERFQLQMKEMIERDWNHPSVIAWSVGNEYPSHTPEGHAWTKDMMAFAKGLDPSRLVTFASMFVWRDFIKKAEDEASLHVDFISTNIYGDHFANLTKIHELYPDKPIFISEFGARADHVKSEQDRVEHLKKAVEDFRKCEYLIGAAVWTFNDYQSIFPGTNANGYRPWGLVTPEREKRAMYTAVQEEFCPATVSLISFEGDVVKLKISARPDFPSYTLRGYTIRCGDQSVKIGTLKPGESETVTFSPKDAIPEIELVKPGDFVILTKKLKR